ncbi:hypothetical protein [Agromyces arachidis]|uniref:hypothetical protein n=1 Tax=Agromyces arachidis TaxID=766966 RepID=UPI0040578E24
MSDEKTTRTDAGEATGAAATASSTMPPTPPAGAEPAGRPATSSTATGTATAAPAGPGEDRDSGDREAVDSVGGTSGSPIGRAADAAADAARTAGARLKEAAENADLDRFADDAKRVTGEWTERVKEEYRRRPGVVIAAGVGIAVVLGAIVRSMGRR